VTPTLWFDAEHTHAAAGVVLVTRDSRLILQLRDDIPEIENPGRITPFAGSAEPGETAPQCAARELEEETGLRVDPAALAFLGEISRVDFHGNNTACVFYVLRDIDPASLAVTEGTMIVLSLEAAAADPRLTPFCHRLAQLLATGTPQ
jgi:8-oxo-dGTP diphosphatase